MNLDFVKMTGAGNDFVLIDNRSRLYARDWSKTAISICNRKFGIGADGLLILEPSASAKFTMLYFNADGTYGGMCGNGGRCVAKYFFDLEGGRELAFNALDHIYHASIVEQENIQLEMKSPEGIRMEIPLIVKDIEIRLHFVNTGSPHAVIFAEDLPEQIALEIASGGITATGRAIRFHQEFHPGGTNVDFVWRSNDSDIIMRTYERGVEDETLACGTGAVASALISAEKFGLVSPVSVHTRSGNILKVGFNRKNNSFSNITLTGPAEVVFKGTIRVSDMGAIDEL